jgi:DNA-binding NarL/FixJ family response regulator
VCAIRVLIVEDDPETRARFTAAVSRDLRMIVAHATATGADAIARLPGARPDVLLVDLGLPDMHGTEVIRVAARVFPEADILVVTALGDEGNVFASIAAGARGYVLKDCADAELVERIVELRAGGAPMSPGIARMVLARLRSGRRAPPPPPGGEGPSLTAREVDVLQLLSRGYSYQEVASQLGVSVHTVSSHVKASYRKLAVHSAAAAVTRAAELDLLRRK